jgi:glycolate oxidase FAD binding subunit
MDALARLANVRPAGPDDAVAGARPSFVASPASTAEVSEVMRAAAELGLAVVPRGTGSKLSWGRPPDRCDLVVDMTVMDQVIEHAAGDLTATVQAGLSLPELADVLGKAGQRLALDPPGPPGTIGGVLAAGAAGPLRLRYGSGRDLLIGITIVRADGTVARSGGRVVKNVAGYDLGKLFAGSRGTLGVITETTFRLHPVPTATAYISADCDTPADVAETVAAALGSAVAPVAAEIDWPSAGAPIAVGIALEGSQAAVAGRARLVRTAWTHAGVIAESAPPWWGTRVADPAGTSVQVAFWPGLLVAVLDAIRATAGAAGLDPAIAGSAGAGVLDVIVPTSADVSAVAGFVTALRSALADRRGGAEGEGAGGGGAGRGIPARANVTVRHAPLEVMALVDPVGPVPSLALMRSVKAQFDPQGILSPGRYP